MTQILTQRKESAPGECKLGYFDSSREPAVLIPLAEPSHRQPHAGARFALFALGFRPFYLLAATFASVAIPAWLLLSAGRIALPGDLAPLAWHAHEMLFGFAAAVIVGFLFTAGRNWTGLATPSGGPLAALALLWIGGRAAMLVAPSTAGALVDLAFLPLAALALGRVLVRAGSRRNYFVVVLLLALSAANGLFHLRALGLIGGDPLQGTHLALALVIVLATTIGGRVIPMFTINGLGGRVMIAPRPRLDITAIALTGAALLGWAGGLPPLPTAALALAAALAQVLRTARWRPWATRGVPLLWVLHAAHGWIPVALVLLALAQAGVVPISAALHGLAVGAMSGLILGMITRTALGHTGRPLVAGRMETTAYVALQAAALARVGPAVLAPALYPAGLHLAGLAWSLAFTLYLLRYAPMLWRPRADGKPG